MDEQQHQQAIISLKPTHVVTCILLRDDGGKPRILLVQRSHKVGSYHARWAGISGFVEPGVSPDEQAYTEIREETGLTNAQVRMLRRGRVVEHIDAELGRHFYIHPFLFAVFAPDQIQTDWEATEMRWISPSELAQYETVPRLQEVYEAALHGEVVHPDTQAQC
jgi:8-oxo-dGTP diphosphatase